MLVFKPCDPDANRVMFYVAGEEVVVEQSGLEVDDSPVREYGFDVEGNEVELMLSQNAELIEALRAQPLVEESGSASYVPPVPVVTETDTDEQPDDPEE